MLPLLLVILFLTGCTTWDEQQARERYAYNQWYNSLSYEERQLENQRELARIQAAGHILSGMALRGGPLGAMPVPPPFVLQPPAVQPLPPPVWNRQPICVTTPAGAYAYFNCY